MGSIRSERHRARELAVSTLYSLDFNKNLPPEDDWERFQGLSDEELGAIPEEVTLYARLLMEGTILHLQEIDDVINKYSTHRPIDLIDAVDRNILRVAFFQLMYDNEVHPTIVIDEAVKLSLELSNAVSFKFINGILDAYVRNNRA